jgi:hypothetical protein
VQEAQLDLRLSWGSVHVSDCSNAERVESALSSFFCPHYVYLWFSGDGQHMRESFLQTQTDSIRPCCEDCDTDENVTLKVHKREKFFSSDFEFFTILYLVKLKY